MRPNVPPGDSELQTRFNQKGFLAGRNMREDAYPTMDVSLLWPLPYQLNHASINLPAATPTYQVLERPTTGRHIVVLRCSMTLRVPDPADNWLLVIRKIMNPAPPPLPTDLILSRYDGNSGLLIPFIATQNFVALPGIPQTSGARPVYIPYGFELGLGLSATNANPLELNWISMEYPETQPLTSLLAGF